MLTSDQCIVEYEAGRARVDRLTRTKHAHYLPYADRMLALYRGGVGQQRRQLHRQVAALFAEEPDCPVRRIQAFCKLLDDQAVYETDPDGSASKLRVEVFSRAARLFPMVSIPDRLFEYQEQATKARIAAELGLSQAAIEEALYADVLAYQRVSRFDGYPDAAALLSRYNVAQVQACLYKAEHMTVTCTGDFKTICRYAKLARLLFEVTCLGPSKYKLVFSGPLSVLRETRRYGLCMARFLPALLVCKGWHMEAVLRTPWNTQARLQMSDRDRFTSHIPAPEEFDSSVEQALAEKFGPVREGWTLIREGAILHDLQRTFIPDFTFRHEDGTEVLLEIVGFWTPEYLEHKRQVLRQFRRPNLLMAIPQTSVRPDAAIGQDILIYKTTLTLKALLERLECIRAHKAP